jgi:hypothetical protein
MSAAEQQMGIAIVPAVLYGYKCLALSQMKQHK